MNVIQTGGEPVTGYSGTVLAAAAAGGHGLKESIQDYMRESHVMCEDKGIQDGWAGAAAAFCGSLRENVTAVWITDNGSEDCACFNKLRGIRAVLGDKPVRVMLGRQENDCNVLVLDYAENGFGVNMESVLKMLTTDFCTDYSRILEQLK
ncbi:RpiB/LacA/LacB family sugar-phosphate isomerase [Anaerolentibacter hominis]|uniref:RpiB/LacA/LacB family sugar-phosphate isomerase n=1 Tax=Anaerolentibacter hominis TaxID=3079009 RepID=UPI0031B7F50C